MIRTSLKAAVHVAEHLLLAAAVIGLGLLLTAGYWLQAGDPPGRCDAMVVLGGNYNRAAYGAELYQLGMAKKVYIGRGARLPGERVLDQNHIAFPRREELYKTILRKKGVPDDAMEYFGDDLLSTAQEADALAAQIGKGPGSLLVVTSPYHVRRARLVFSRALPEWRVRVVGTPAERIPAAWWNDRESARVVLLEIPKTIFYILGGRFRSAPPAN